MIDLSSYPILNDRKSTLKETSKDDSDINDIHYMTSSVLDAVNFDLVKRCYVNELGLSEDVATSVDAIVSFADRISFVEFKNGRVNNRTSKIKPETVY